MKRNNDKKVGRLRVKKLWRLINVGISSRINMFKDQSKSTGES